MMIIRDYLLDTLGDNFMWDIGEYDTLDGIQLDLQIQTLRREQPDFFHFFQTS